MLHVLMLIGRFFSRDALEPVPAFQFDDPSLKAQEDLTSHFRRPKIRNI